MEEAYDWYGIVVVETDDYVEVVYGHWMNGWWVPSPNYSTMKVWKR